ncbi:hypothetical protein [Pontibacter liquoris]|uniref:hypothetical protein n=1 Tax=Pontibacter liquoris TaxID=2905677 RepID=UPI001FA80EA5|nr:hypothetical protein [Pontibacter liquoris]
MSIGKDNVRSLLKKILTGSLAADSAALELLRAKGTIPLLIVVQHENGLYSIGEDTGLTQVQMKERVKGAVHAIIDSEDYQLGSTAI